MRALLKRVGRWFITTGLYIIGRWFMVIGWLLIGLSFYWKIFWSLGIYGLMIIAAGYMMIIHDRHAPKPVKK